ncbi:hypothetical protein GQ54DRAFT_160739 [Martensiomyces pterosporus]|nr:hypothetical protein GQ54DRAFT_160739 [Martensiomyces pterosporus]
MSTAAGGNGDVPESTSAQLQLYQAVPVNLDNLYPYSHSLPFHTVPSPANTTGSSAAGTRLAHHDQLAAHLEGNAKSSLYTLRSQPDTCIQWRLLADRTTLELRPLRWIDNASSGAQGIASEATASVASSWRFASQLLDTVVIADEVTPLGDTHVSVTVCSKDGVIYRLSFASVWAISSDSIDVNACTSWYQVEWCHEAGSRSVPGRLPVIFDGLGSGVLAVGCEDSALVWIQWRQIPDEAHGDLQGFVVETVSSSTGILKSVKDFIPRILRRSDDSSRESEGAPTRLVSFAITQVLDGSVQYAVTLSRDRKLRFWSSSWSSACQHEEQLPLLDPLGNPIPIDPHGPQPPLLEPSVRNCVRVVSHSIGLATHDSEMEAGRDNMFGVLVFVPDEATPYFAFLQVSVDAQSRVSDVRTIMYKVCKATNGASQLMADDELADFQILHHEESVTQLVEGPDGQPAEEEDARPYWTLWALWERAQEPVLTYSHFSLKPEAYGEEEQGLQFEGHPILGERWYTVFSRQHSLRPTNDGSRIKEIEARLAKDSVRQGSGTSDDDHAAAIDGDTDTDGTPEQTSKGSGTANAVQAGEISRAFLDHLFNPVRFDRGVLEHALGLYETSARDRGFDFPAAPYRATASSPQLRQRVAAVVGSFLRVETSRKDGAMLVGDYHRALFTEWMRYSTLCSRIQRVSNTPRSLALCDSTNMVCIVSSNGIAVVQTAGEIEWMHAIAERDPAASVLLSAPEHAVAGSYPALAQGNARTEVARLLSAATYLSTSMSPDGLSALTDEMTLEASGEMLVSYETRAVELFEQHAASSIKPRHVRHAARLLGSCRAPAETMRNLLQALVQSTDIAAPITALDDPQSFKSSASMDGLFAAGFAISNNARFELARDIAVMLICVTYHYEELGGVELQKITSLLASSVKVFSLLAVLQWVSSQSIGACGREAAAEDSGAVDGFLRKFSVLNINKRRDSAGSTDSGPATGASAVAGSANTFVYSLLHDVIARNYSLRFVGRSGVFADMVTEGVLQIYATLGLTTAWSDDSTLQSEAQTQTSLVLFAARLERSVPAELADSFLRFLPKTTALCYLNGLVSLRMRDYASAAELFASAGVAYSQVTEGIRSGVDLQYVLPKPVLESGHAFVYYQHVAELFEAARQLPAVSRFCHLSLQSLQEESELEESEIPQTLLSERRQKLWFKIFHAELESSAYEEAYMAMMANPDQKMQLDCLRHLTGVLCERDGGTAILCRLSFTGLQEEVERNLLFKARHSDPTAKPNYYKILYAFHVYRGNYRNAASAMYQYARRLSMLMLYSGDVASLLVEQGQALLSCINGLSLVDKQYAWVVVGRNQNIAGSSDAGCSTKRKRRRIAIGRYDASSASQGQDIDIVELADVRREYTLCMARITLGTTFQELFSRNVLLEPEDVIALFVKTGMYDSAVAFAKRFELRLDYIFTTLAQKCLELSATKSAKTQREQTQEAFWENACMQESTGTPAERAWRLLQYYLDLDDAERQGSQQYRLVVAEIILKAEGDAVLPPWLSSPLLRKCPQDLVRLCLRNGCITEGAEFLLHHINTLCNKPAPAAHEASAGGSKNTRELWLPYQLIDQTMGILDNAVVRFDEAVAKIREAKKQGGSESEVAKLKSLLKSYRNRLRALEQLSDDLKASFDRYLAFATRESQDISENLSSDAVFVR